MNILQTVAVTTLPSDDKDSISCDFVVNLYQHGLQCINITDYSTEQSAYNEHIRPDLTTLSDYKNCIDSAPHHNTTRCYLHYKTTHKQVTARSKPGHVASRGQEVKVTRGQLIRRRILSDTESPNPQPIDHREKPNVIIALFTSRNFDIKPFK